MCKDYLSYELICVRIALALCVDVRFVKLFPIMPGWDDVEFGGGFETIAVWFKSSPLPIKKLVDCESSPSSLADESSREKRLWLST